MIGGPLAWTLHVVIFICWWCRCSCKATTVEEKASDHTHAIKYGFGNSLWRYGMRDMEHTARRSETTMSTRRGVIWVGFTNISPYQILQMHPAVLNHRGEHSKGTAAGYGYSLA